MNKAIKILEDRMIRLCENIEIWKQDLNKEVDLNRKDSITRILYELNTRVLELRECIRLLKEIK